MKNVHDIQFIPSATYLPRERMFKLGLKYVPRSLLDGIEIEPESQFYKQVLAQFLPGDLAEWIKVGHIYCHIAEWDEETKSMWYDHIDEVVFVNGGEYMKEQQKFREEQSEPLRYSPFASLHR